jgi:hypothetical protein
LRLEKRSEQLMPMQSRYRILVLACVLVSLLVPALASASTGAYRETRVRGLGLENPYSVRAECAVSRGTHRGYALAYDDLASGFLLAARGATKWGKAGTLGDHFARHGADFGAKSANDYARMADDFFEQSQKAGLPTKIGPDGTIRVYDPASNTFGAFNADGTTKTFFKPSSPNYFDNQPGVFLPPSVP